MIGDVSESSLLIFSRVKHLNTRIFAGFLFIFFDMVLTADAQAHLPRGMFTLRPESYYGLIRANLYDGQLFKLYYCGGPIAYHLFKEYTRFTVG